MTQKQKSYWLLLEDAKSIGLPLQDYMNAKEMFEHAEWEVGFDIIVQQLYELNIKITESFFQKTEAVALSLKVPIDGYSFMKELIINS